MQIRVESFLQGKIFFVWICVRHFSTRFVSIYGSWPYNEDLVDNIVLFGSVPMFCGGF